MNGRNNEQRPLLTFTTSMIIFGTIGLIRRSIPLPSAVIAFVRGITGGSILLLFLLATGKRNRTKIPASSFAGLCITGAIMGFNWILLFEAYHHTTVAIATLCYYMQPTIVVLLSPIFFKEKLTPQKICFAAIALAGMVLISWAEKPDGQTDGLKGILLGLGAAGLYAAVIILNKKINGVDALRKTVIQLFSAGVSMLPYMLVTGSFFTAPVNLKTTLLLLVAGIVHTGIAYILYFGSLPRLPAQTAAIFSYIDPVSALLFSTILLGEPIGLTGVIGAVMIIGSAIGYALPGRKKGSDQPCQSSRHLL